MTKADEYEHMEDLKHVRKRPENYVGAMEPRESEVYVYDSKLETIKYLKYRRSSAFLQVLYEAASNIVDAALDDSGDKMSKIQIDFNDTTIRFYNNGPTIPVETYKKDGPLKGKYLPEVVLGNLRTGSNYNDDKERLNSGRNGYGVKLLNILSHEFSIRTRDKERGLLYTQTWTDGMTKYTEPVITKSRGAGFTEITVKPDFKFLEIEKFDECHQSEFMRMMAEVSMHTGLRVVVNDNPIDGVRYTNKTVFHIKKKRDYAKLYEGKSNREYVELGDENLSAIVYASEEPKTVSFVNGVATRLGGKHVDAWTKTVFANIRDLFVNAEHKKKVTPAKMREFFAVYVWAKTPNPKFDHQTKDCLASGKFKPEYDPDSLKKIKKWSVASGIKTFVDTKTGGELKDLGKPKSGKRVISKTLNNAVLAGQRPDQCIFCFAEGNSAMNFLYSGAGKEFELDGKTFQGQQQVGFMGTKGKILNVDKATPKQIKANVEIAVIMQALGIRTGVDYTIEKNFKTLRYHYVCIVVDADTDGSHIAGLILNFFKCIAPSLLYRKNFICAMHTPVVHASVKGCKKVNTYYTYANFVRDKKTFAFGDIQYSKGLGSLNDKQIRQYYGAYFSWFVNDKNGFKSITKAFGPDGADQRKEWIAEHDSKAVVPMQEPDSEQKTTLAINRDISQFIDDELVEHATENCGRSLPHFGDGLKESQRMILYTVRKHKFNTSKKRVKVSQLAGYVSADCPYHHGEASLHDAISKMAQIRIDAGNINYLYPDGQFGSRIQNGHDASQPRYLHTYTEGILEYMFRVEDTEVLDYVADEGMIAQPTCYVGVVSNMLINGGRGTGTGWSSAIPQYNPVDVIGLTRDWIGLYKRKRHAFKIIGGQETCRLQEITPYYYGFTGEIEKRDETHYTTKGILTRLDATGREIENTELCNDNELYTYRITELPVGKSTLDYGFFLENLVDEGIIVIRDKSCTKRKVGFVIDSIKHQTLKTLKMTSSIALTNMVAIDDEGRPTRYDCPQRLLDAHCKIRLELYKKRIAYTIAALRKDEKIRMNKARFITEVNSDVMVLKGKTKNEVAVELEETGYDLDPTKGNYEYLLSIPVSRLCADEKTKHEKKLVEIQDKIAEYIKLEPTDLWLKEIDEFEKALTKHYAYWDQEHKLTDISNEKAVSKMSKAELARFKRAQKKAAEKYKKNKKK